MTDTLYGIWGSTLTGIADAIRTKNPDVTGLVDPADMRQDILDISGEPTKVLISEFDLTNATSTYGFIDNVKKVKLPSQRYTGMGYGKISARNNKILLYRFNYGDIGKVEIKMGTTDTTIETSDNVSILLNLVNGNGHVTLTWREDLRYWQYNDASSGQYLTDITSKYYFDNKTIILFYGAKYVNGELYKVYNNVDYAGKYSIWVDDGTNMTELIAMTENVTGDIDTTIPTIRLGSRGSNGFVGAVFESVKIWQYFNKYETPVSLMSARLSEEPETIEEETE